MIAGLIALGWYGYLQWREGQVRLTFVGVAGGVPALELTAFPDRLTFTSPSPPPPFGELSLAAAVAGGDGKAMAHATLDGDLVPGRAVVRYRGEGVGAGIVFVELGKEFEPIQLTAPRTIRGRVVEPVGFWEFGWRCAGVRPVPAAEIIAMAGGEHGIEIGSTTADDEGRFELTGIAADVHPLSLRVRVLGFELQHVEAVPLTADDVDGSLDDPVLLAVQRTELLRGRVETPPGLDPSDLWVLARGLPGVQAQPERDGSFELDHLPPGVSPRLLVHGLGDFFGCPEITASRGTAALFRVVPAGVVRGRVVDRETSEPLAGALVFPGDAVAVRSDADGYFELVHVMPGAVEITAQYKQRLKRRRHYMRFGRVRVDVVGGEASEGVVIEVD
ncbi:MAG: hypothetical protein NXI31_05845 [bacterium]|nr:hypothetical protein [bacterium]